jgi:hypothetical protein
MDTESRQREAGRQIQIFEAMNWKQLLQKQTIGQ